MSIQDRLEEVRKYMNDLLEELDSIQEYLDRFNFPEETTEPEMIAMNEGDIDKSCFCQHWSFKNRNCSLCNQVPPEHVMREPWKHCKQYIQDEIPF